MPTLYFDEDSQNGVILRLVRDAGVSATCSAEHGMNGTSDDEQMAFAANLGFTLVTANANDFRRIQTRWGKESKQHAGIVIRSQSHAPSESVRRLKNLLEQVSDTNLQHGIFYLANYG